MKNKLFFPLIGFLFMTLIGCSKSDATDNTTTNGNGGNPTTPAGSWRISHYFDDRDETSDFAGYNFVFDNSGSVIATRSGASVTGTWSTTSTKFILSFGADPVLSELNDDWQIVERTSTSIKLKEDNPAQNDRLEFVRN